MALGGGANDFLPMALNGRRKDGRDLLTEFQKQGCRLVRTKADLENIESFQEGGVIGVFAPEALAKKVRELLDRHSSPAAESTGGLVPSSNEGERSRKL